MSQALYRKWRSRTFAELVGQPHVVRTLENALRTDRVAHAYLFNGPRGTGKTSAARLLAKALNCTAETENVPCGTCATCTAVEEARYLDLIEIDAASNNGVEDIRELRNTVGFSATEGQRKVYIIDEVHMLSLSAFNALLKTLEEPPAHVHFILATTEIHRIPATVISRCQRFDFRRIRTEEIEAHLDRIARSEGCAVERSALSLLATSAQGCMRDAIGLLDQVVNFGHESVSLEQVQSMLGLSDIGAINAFVRSMVEGDQTAGLTTLRTVTEQGRSLPEFLRQVVLQLRYALRLSLTDAAELLEDVTPDQMGEIQTWTRKWSPERIHRALGLFMDALSELGRAQYPDILIELAYVQAVMAPASAPSAQPAAATVARAATPAPTPRAKAVTPPPAPRPPAPDPFPAPDAEEEAWLKSLRSTWRALRADLRTAHKMDVVKALGTEGGLTGLRIAHHRIHLSFRTDRARDVVKAHEEIIREHLEGALPFRVVQLVLQVGDHPFEEPNQYRETPFTDRVRMDEVHRFLVGEKQAEPLSGDARRRVLERLQRNSSDVRK